MWYIHTVGYYPANKRNEVMKHATTWMNLVKLSYLKEASYKRSHIVLFQLYEISRTGKVIDPQSRLQIHRQRK